MRTGAAYLEALGDGRDVYLDGERIRDVAAHPAFRGVAQSVAGLYDLAIEHRDEVTFPSPATGEPVLNCFLIPRSREDLKRRRRMIRLWSDATAGLLGRTPDHVAGFLAGFASRPDIFARAGAPFGENVVRFYERARDNHWYVAYTIIQPQIDRSKSAHELEDAYLAAGVCEERDGGIVIRGAQMLGTGAVLADWLFLSCIQPLKPGDEDYAMSVVVPISAPGLRLYPRRGYAEGTSSVFDYPLSSRFDETDALVVFHDVFVPWEHVFVSRDISLARAQWFETPAHILGNNQAQIRLTSKVQFLAGLARKIARTNRVDRLPPVQGQLGEIAALAATVEGMELASEMEAVETPYGVVHPNPRFLYGAMGLQAKLYPQLVMALRELSGGGLIQLPSSVKSFFSEATAQDVRRFVQSPGVPAEDRVKLFKLAWDLLGSEFGGRHLQYEMFYAGAPFVAKAYAYHNYGFEGPEAMVDTMLESYSIES